MRLRCCWFTNTGALPRCTTSGSLCQGRNERLHISGLEAVNERQQDRPVLKTHAAVKRVERIESVTNTTLDRIRDVLLAGDTQTGDDNIARDADLIVVGNQK